MPSRAPARPSLATMEADCAAFNAAHAIGDTIHVWTGVIEGDASPRGIRFPAEVLGGHTAVVYVDGGGGCVALTHVREWRERKGAGRARGALRTAMRAEQ